MLSLQINNDCCGKSGSFTFVLSFLEMFPIPISEKLLPQSDGCGFSYQPKALMAGLMKEEVPLWSFKESTSI